MRAVRHVQMYEFIPKVNRRYTVERPQCRPKSQSTLSLDFQLLHNDYIKEVKGSHLPMERKSPNPTVCAKLYNRKTEDVSTNRSIYCILQCI